MISNSAVIICTIARPDGVEEAVVSVLNQSTAPALVVIVDGSDSQPISRSLNSLRQLSTHLTRIIHVECQRGLPLQRNRGIGAALSENPELDYVHFIDDDVVLERSYIENIENIFQSYSDAIVVGGHDENRIPKRHSLLGRLGLFDSVHEGRILRSAFNIICESSNQTTQVQWLSGLSQSFRVSLLGGLRFSESIRFYGEEVDMHIRCAEFGKLYWTPLAKLQHRSSEIGRDHLAQSTFETDRFKYGLCNSYADRFNKFLFLYATLAHTIVKIVQGTMNRDLGALEVAKGHLLFLRELIRL